MGFLGNKKELFFAMVDLLKVVFPDIYHHLWLCTRKWDQMKRKMDYALKQIKSVIIHRYHEISRKPSVEKVAKVQSSTSGSPPPIFLRARSDVRGIPGLFTSGHR